VIPKPLKLPTHSARVRAENKNLWNEARSSIKADFYTIGYEGRSVQELITILQNSSLKSLIDIRFSPISMYRPELSKTNFRKALEAVGINYLHVPEWGVPKDIRAKAIATGTREIIWEWYDTYIVDRFFSKNLHWFLNIEHPVALMCYEADPTECHRHRVFMALEKQGLIGFDL
jgi:uncharacterized protein (DUF488 family)